MTEEELSKIAIGRFADQAHRPVLARTVGVLVDEAFRAENRRSPISEGARRQLAALLFAFLESVDDTIRKGDAS